MLSRINQGRSMEIERGRGRPKEKPHLREHLGFVRAVERQVDAHHLIRLCAHKDALVLGPGVPADGAHLIDEGGNQIDEGGNQIDEGRASQQTVRTCTPLAGGCSCGRPAASSGPRLQILLRSMRRIISYLMREAIGVGHRR